MITDQLPSYTCPRCGKSSWNPHDGENAWCGACNDFTGTPIRLGVGDRPALVVGWIDSAADEVEARGQLARLLRALAVQVVLDVDKTFAEMVRQLGPPPEWSRWEGTLAVLDVPSVDHRKVLTPTWAPWHRDLPLPLLSMPLSTPENRLIGEPKLVGTITELRIDALPGRDGFQIRGAGDVDLDLLATVNPDFATALKENGTVGIGVDLTASIPGQPGSGFRTTPRLDMCRPDGTVLTDEELVSEERIENPCWVVSDWAIVRASLNGPAVWPEATIRLTQPSTMEP